MSVAIIELNDSEIRVARDDEIVLRSPGYAVVSRNGVEVGSAAARKARLNPRAQQNRYWQNLNLDPLPSPTARVRHHADLAYAHLLEIHEQSGRPDEVLFAVPGHYSNEQLALLLGLVEASPFRAVGLVDSAVAAAASRAGPGTWVHAEIYLHQTVLTHLEVTEEVSRTSVEAVDGAGLVAVMDDCAAMISELFIRQSRFDPQHHAETEQSLYNQIPECLRALGDNSEAAIEIPYQRTAYLVKLPRAAVLEALQPVYRKIARALPEGAFPLIGDRLSGLPGFVAQLGAAEVLGPECVFQSCRAQFERIRSSGSALDFVTRLPTAPGAIARPATTPAVPGASTPSAAPRELNAVEVPVTHVLCGHRAWPLNQRRLYLATGADMVRACEEGAHCRVSSGDGGTRVEAQNGRIVYLNGRRIDAPVHVRIGDVVTFDGTNTEYTFINVES